MTRTSKDIDRAEGTYASGDTVELELAADGADHGVVTIDDGAGGEAGDYSLTYHLYDPEFDDWIHYREDDKQADRAHTFDPLGTRTRITFEAQNSDDYRIRAESFKTRVTR